MITKILDVNICRAGTRWTEDEVQQLIFKASSNKNLQDIAREHKRTFYSIKLKLFQQALKIMQTDKLDFEEISKRLNINAYELEAYKIKLDAEEEYKQLKYEKEKKNDIQIVNMQKEIQLMQNDIKELKRKMEEFINITKETKLILEKLEIED